MLTDRHRKTKTNESWCSRPCRCTSVPLIICPSVLGCVYVPLSHSVEFGWPLILCRTLWRDRNKTQTVLLGSGQSTGRGTLGTVTSVVVSNTMPWEPEEEKRFSLKGMEEDKEGNDALYRQWWEKAMAPHSSTLAWKIPWMEEPGRLQSMGLLWVGHDCVIHCHFSLSCIGEGNGNPLQCSCLENPRDRGAWWAAVYGVV